MLWNRYPKFILLVLSLIPAYFVFADRNVAWLHEGLIGLGILGVFFAGIFYSYAFTSATATAVLLILGSHTNIYVGAFLGGLGALASDVLILRIIQRGFKDEVNRLRHEWFVLWIGNLIPRWCRRELLSLLGAMVIASPLPDELGVTLLAVSQHLTMRRFMLISYIANTTGILTMLALGRVFF